jgi:uncharacterized protein YaaW (UPF0174 family)
MSSTPFRKHLILLSNPQVLFKLGQSISLNAAVIIKTTLHAQIQRDGESMVLIDLLYWNATALRFPRGKNA